MHKLLTASAEFGISRLLGEAEREAFAKRQAFRRTLAIVAAFAVVCGVIAGVCL